MTDQTGNDLSDFSMMDLFRMELDNQIAVLNNGLLALEHDHSSADILETLMRAAHSIKGAARMVNVNAVVRLSHFMEDCFVAFQSGDGELQNSDIDILLAGVDLMQQISTANDEQLNSWDSDHQKELLEMENALKSINQQSERMQAEAGVSENVTPASAREEFANENEEEIVKTQRIHNATPQAIRISVERLDQILSLAGKSLVETHQLNALMPSFWQIKHNQQVIISQVNSLQENLSNNSVDAETKEQLKSILTNINNVRHEYADSMATLDAIDRRMSTISDHLHREVMASRMRPISEIFNALPRVVRDLGRKLNKEVRLQMSGLSTLVDRNVLERIDIPLKHIVQNAIDHGIELPEDRTAKGKNRLATINLHATMNAGMLFIVLEDDGAGIDYVALKQRILDKGLATEQELANLDDGAMLDFLFYPGFSTRSTVSDISGRGVGLDLVKDTVSTLNGSVQAASVSGQGMRFQLILPLTVSVLRAMLVTICGESYAFPMSAVDRIFYANSSDIVTRSRGSTVNIDDNEIPLINANAIYQGVIPQVLPDQLTILVLDNGEKTYGVVVENVEGEEELSIHKLSQHLGKIRTINSAAILNSGALTLIIDIDEYMHTIDQHFKQQTNVALCEDADLAVCTVIRVLVVDDSITVRETERKLLKSLHYSVSVAKDGQEALGKLQTEHFDMLITDVDMPNMDGLTLVNEVRFYPGIENMPVMIVSNREKSFIEQSVILNEKTLFYSKDHFQPNSFIERVQQLVKLVVNALE